MIRGLNCGVSMEIQELKALKRHILNKYKKTKDHDLILLKRCIDKIVERKLKNEDRNRECKIS